MACSPMQPAPKVTKGVPGVPVYKTFPIDDLMSNDPRHHFRSCTRVTLDNRVSPIFSRNNMGNMDFDAIYPALQLVTLLLETPCTMGYYSGICLSKPQETSYYEKPCTYKAIFRKPEPLSVEDIVGIKKFFAALAPYLQFEHAELPNHAHGTTRMEGPRVACGTFDIGSIGSGTRIRISTEIYQSLLTAIEANKQNPDSVDDQERLFTLYFVLAHVLGHELAYASRLARFGTPGGFSYPFENRAFSEDGFDWEAIVFSGIPNYQTSSEEPSFCLTDWPCPAIIENYLRRGANDIAVTASLQSLTSMSSYNVWRIAPCVLRAFFQKDFWQSVVPQMGAAALKPPKLLGVRMAPVGVGRCISCDCGSCFWMKEHALRAYERGNGRIEKAGSRRDEIVELEMARLQAEGKFGCDQQRREAQLRLDLMTMKRPEHANSLADCVRHGGWATWMGPKSLGDKRDMHNWGVPLLFKSFSDGTLVATEHFDCLEAFASGQY